MGFGGGVVSGDEIMNGGDERHVRVERRIRRVIRERKMPVLSLYCMRNPELEGYSKGGR